MHPPRTTATIAQPGTRDIVVQRTEVEKTGQKNNKPWTLYRVFATELDGTPISDTLKTFDRLKSGRVTVSSEAFVRNGNIEHYTLKRANTQDQRNGGAPSAGLEARVSQLESEVAELRQKFEAAIRAFGEE